MGEYVQLSSDMYGGMPSTDQPRRLVPYLVFERKSDNKHCRIPLEVYERHMRDGLSQNQILELHADWYEDSNIKFQKAYHKAIAERDSKERAFIRKSGLEGNEYIKACVDKIVKAKNRVIRKGAVGDD